MQLHHRFKGTVKNPQKSCDHRRKRLRNKGVKTDVCRPHHFEELEARVLPCGDTPQAPWLLLFIEKSYINYRQKQSKRHPGIKQYTFIDNHNWFITMSQCIKPLKKFILRLVQLGYGDRLPYQRTALCHWCDRCFLWKSWVWERISELRKERKQSDLRVVLTLITYFWQFHF